MGSSNFIFSQNYVKAGENLEKYYGGADFKKNHVFTMSKTGANYDPLTIDEHELEEMIPRSRNNF